MVRFFSGCSAEQTPITLNALTGALSSFSLLIARTSHVGFAPLERVKCYVDKPLFCNGPVVRQPPCIQSALTPRAKGASSSLTILRPCEVIMSSDNAGALSLCRSACT